MDGFKDSESESEWESRERERERERERPKAKSESERSCESSVSETSHGSNQPTHESATRLAYAFVILLLATVTWVGSQSRIPLVTALVWFGLVWFGLVWFGLVS